MVAEVKAFKSDDGKVYPTFNDAKRADIKHWFKEISYDSYSGATLQGDGIATQIIMNKSCAANIQLAAKKFLEAVS